MVIEPFSLPYSQEAVDDLRQRVRRTRWPDEAPAGPWTQGFDRAALIDLCRYWADKLNECISHCGAVGGADASARL